MRVAAYAAMSTEYVNVASMQRSEIEGAAGNDLDSAALHRGYDKQIVEDRFMKTLATSEDQSASDLITKRIADLGDWRGETLARMRKLIKAAVPDVVEEWKWMGTPVWSHNGIICTGESYNDKVKLTFAKGASLKDPTHLFNSSLDGNVRRAFDIFEGGEVDEAAFKALVLEAVALNGAGKVKTAKKTKS